MENVSKSLSSQEETIPLATESQTNENTDLSEDLLETVGIVDDGTEVNESETTAQLVSPRLIDTQIDRDLGESSESSTGPANDDFNPTRRGSIKRKRQSTRNRKQRFSSLNIEELNSSKIVGLLNI